MADHDEEINENQETLTYSKDKELVSDSSEKDKIEHDKSKAKLKSWLNKTLKIEITDGRILIGNFLCTDRDQNIILSCCWESTKQPNNCTEAGESRALGLVMVPGKHIISIFLETSTNDNFNNNDV